jgi:3-isopropylmalate/(R)-2-methylmalate dehydratase large subunit
MPDIIDTLWASHVVHRSPGAPNLLYVDFHLLHEGSSPQGFDGLRAAGRAVRRPDLTPRPKTTSCQRAPSPSGPPTQRPRC